MNVLYGIEYMAYSIWYMGGCQNYFPLLGSSFFGIEAVMKLTLIILK